MSEDLEVVWHGGLHKTIPQPPVALKPRQENRPWRDRLDQVLTAVTPEWQMVREIATAAELTLDSTTKYLAALSATGQIERSHMDPDVRRPGRGQMVRYRRVR